MPEALVWGGVDVTGWVRDFSGLLHVPGRRGENVQVAGRDGAIRQERKPYDGREVPLEFMLGGRDPATGLVPVDGQRRQWQRNVDLFTSLVVMDVADLVHTLDDGTQRRLPVEVLGTTDLSRLRSGSTSKAKVVFTSHEAWWRGLLPVTSTFTLADNGTAALAEFAASTGRIDDALVTFALGTSTGNNPTLSQPSTGIGIGYDFSFGAAQRITLGDYSWNPVGMTFERVRLRTDPRIGPWWVLDCGRPGVAPTVHLDLTGGGPMQISVTARPSWAIG